MNRTARKGDVALVTGVQRSSSGGTWNGELVEVLTDPLPQFFPINGVKELGNRTRLGKQEAIIATRCLIPLPPPDEARTLFASESDAREVKA